MIMKRSKHTRAQGNFGVRARADVIIVFNCSKRSFFQTLKNKTSLRLRLKLIYLLNFEWNFFQDILWISVSCSAWCITKPIKYKKAFIKCKNTIGRRPFRVTKEVTCNKKPKKFWDSQELDLLTFLTIPNADFWVLHCFGCGHHIFEKEIHKSQKCC